MAGRLHVELMRVSGAVPERLSCGDDSSENSSECSCYEVMDTSGEIVHMAKRLTCRVKNTSQCFVHFKKCRYLADVLLNNYLLPVLLCGAGTNQGGHRSATQPVQLCLLSVHLLGAGGAHCGSSHGQPGQTVPSKPRCPVHCTVQSLQSRRK